MSRIVIRAGFDPLTKHELQIARILNKKGFDVFFVPYKEGIQPLEVRKILIEKAIHPYRKMYFGLPSDDVISVEIEGWDTEEKSVRDGKFCEIPNGARDFILKNGLYLENVVDSLCKPKRANHSRAVAKLCKELAHAHGLDETEAYIAGMLHDVTKKWSVDEGKELLSVYDPDKLLQNDKIWHSYTCPLFLKHEMGLYNQKILHAIYHHTLGTGKSALDHILYIADKTEPTRGYDSTEQVALAKKNLKMAAKRVLNESKQYIRDTEGINV